MTEDIKIPEINFPWYTRIPWTWILTTILLVAKVFSGYDVSWWIVFAPVLVWPSIIVAFLVLGLAVSLVGGAGWGLILLVKFIVKGLLRVFKAN